MSTPTTHFVWEFDASGAKKPPSQVEPELAQLNLKVGKPIGEQIEGAPPSRVSFVVPEEMELEDYQFNIAGLPLWSDRLRSAVQAFEIEHVEYIPATLSTPRGMILNDDYRLANVLRRVKAFDWDQSVYDGKYRAHGFAGRIDKLVLYTNSLAGEHLFRLDEAPRVLIVSGELRRHLEDLGLTGIRFLHPDDYQV